METVEELVDAIHRYHPRSRIRVTDGTTPFNIEEVYKSEDGETVIIKVNKEKDR